MKSKAIIVDLDGTLCNTQHRQHYMEGKKKNWQAFYDGLVNDEPNEWCLSLINAMEASGHRILFVSGRPDSYKHKTVLWLNTNTSTTAYKLFMRREGDFRKDSIVKQEIYRELIEPSFDVVFCVDDRQQVVDAWREIGLTCLQCAKGDF